MCTARVQTDAGSMVVMAEREKQAPGFVVLRETADGCWEVGGRPIAGWG
jgi:hypothetical protein